MQLAFRVFTPDRTILVPLEGVCMQLGTLRSRRVLHSALARLMLHVDHFVDACLVNAPYLVQLVMSSTRFDLGGGKSYGCCEAVSNCISFYASCCFCCRDFFKLPSFTQERWASTEESVMQFHQIFEGRLFEQLRQRVGPHSTAVVCISFLSRCWVRWVPHVCPIAGTRSPGQQAPLPSGQICKGATVATTSDAARRSRLHLASLGFEGAANSSIC